MTQNQPKPGYALVWILILIGAGMAVAGLLLSLSWLAGAGGGIGGSALVNLIYTYRAANHIRRQRPR